MTIEYPIITMEEHWLSRHTMDFYAAKGVEHPNREHGLVGHLTEKLMECGSQRLQAMDKAGITIQVISHAPNSIALDLATCVKVNDELHGLIKSQPRLEGFATLPMIEGRAAGEELRRCVKQFGFLGTLIDSNCNGKFYDDEHFWPVFEAAEQLDVPVYLHPAPNTKTKLLLYDGNYSEAVAQALSEFGWGWHNEVAVHFLRLFSAGLFDRYPKLNLVLGHMGEMLPYQLDRIEGITRMFPRIGVNLRRPLRQVWDENVWITTSGMFFLAPMAACLRQCKHDRIIHSVDYPFGDGEAGLEFLKTIKQENMVTNSELEGIACKNAERVLKIRVRP